MVLYIFLEHKALLDAIKLKDKDKVEKIVRNIE